MITVKILLKSKPLTTGKYPVVMRVIKNRKIKLISLGMSCPKSEWSNETFKKKHHNYRKRNKILSNLKNKALTIIDEFYEEEKDFTLNDFEAKFRGKEQGGKSITVFDFWSGRISELMKTGNIGNAKAYSDTKNSFFKFSADKSILFKDITVAKVMEYETFLRTTGNISSGVSIKMRTLKALFNLAIKKGVTKRSYYPFDVYKTSKLKSNPEKRALTILELQLFKKFKKDKYPNLLDTWNYFMFSFYLRGLNWTDLVQLKWSNIKGNNLDFIRSKTGKRFVIKLLKPAGEIVKYYKKVNKGGNYIFPVLKSNTLTPVQIHTRKISSLKKYNKQLKQIASIQGINQEMSSYWARHSYCMFLKAKNVPTGLIQESAGHKTEETTLAYLKGFSNDVLDTANEVLLEL